MPTTTHPSTIPAEDWRELVDLTGQMQRAALLYYRLNEPCTDPKRRDVAYALWRLVEQAQLRALHSVAERLAVPWWDIVVGPSIVMVADGSRPRIYWTTG